MNATTRGAMLAILALGLLLVSVSAFSMPTDSAERSLGSAPGSAAVATELGGWTAPAALAGRPVGRLHLPPWEAVDGEGSVSGRAGSDASGDSADGTATEWLTAFGAGASPWVDPDAEARILANERAWLTGAAPHEAVPITAAVLVIPVEFTETETLTYQVQNAARQCYTVTNTFSGPLHGEVPYPGGDVTNTIDNYTVYYPSTEAEDYEQLIFGRTGYTVPLRAGDPNVNDGAGVNISGLTVQSYYAAQSDDSVAITGTVASWVPIAHSEAYYGLDVCLPNISPRAMPDQQLGSLAELTVLAAEGLKSRGGKFATYEFWKRFDRNDDGLVDSLWIVHGGRGQEYGGGAQGEWSIWSRASSVVYYEGYEGGYTIHDNGTASTDDDIRVGPFTMLPEDSDIGVLIEEFGHSFFGLLDLYTMNSSNSIGYWAPMSAGIWGGELGGTRPVNMPLWFRMVADCDGQPCGWADPVKVISYTTPAATVVLGQAGEPAGGVVQAGPYAGETIHEGVRIELPDQIEVVPNKAGEGGGAYSGAATGRNLTLAREIDLTAVAEPVTLSLDGYWRMRRYWGYTYVEISKDGQPFESIPDMDGNFTDANPYGLNEGFGMTGDGAGPLRFDLSGFAGSKITLRFRYFTYMGAPGTGWWIDNVSVSGGTLEEDFAGGIADWSASGWTAVPYTKTHPHHYLVEWRNNNGFDKALEYAYSTNYSDQDEWRVDRLSANVPGAVIMYRNLKYPFSGAFEEQLNDPPSIGSKYGLLVLDTNFWPVERPSSEPFAGRLESLDAPLALQDQPGFTLEIRDQDTKALLGKESVSGAKGITRFDDAFGYYPGFYTDAENSVEPWDEDASVVIPSRNGEIYSTRITGPGRERPHQLDGTPAGGGHYYGSGNPGDANLQYGLHVELVDQAEDGSWGAIRVYNAGVDYELTAEPKVAFPGRTVAFTVSIDNFGAADATVAYTLTLPTGFEAIAGQLEWLGDVPAGETVHQGIVTRVPVPLHAGDGAELRAEVVFDDGTDLWTRTVDLHRPTGVYLPAAVKDSALGGADG